MKEVNIEDIGSMVEFSDDKYFEHVYIDELVEIYKIENEVYYKCHSGSWCYCRTRKGIIMSITVKEALIALANGEKITSDLLELNDYVHLSDGTIVYDDGSKCISLAETLNDNNLRIFKPTKKVALYYYKVSDRWYQSGEYFESDEHFNLVHPHIKEYKRLSDTEIEV